MSIGEVVKNWRESHNYSQEQLAKLIGVSQPFLSEFEAGAKCLGEFTAIELQKLSESEISALDCVMPEKRSRLESLMSLASRDGAGAE